MTVTENYIDLGGTVYYFDRAGSLAADLPRTKENALLHYMIMTVKSWTYARMTASEKNACLDALKWAAETGALRGNFEARFYILHSVYYAFLAGIGYSGADWREAV